MGTLSKSVVTQLDAVHITSIIAEGKVLGGQSQLLYGVVPGATIGDLCSVERRDGSWTTAQVVSFKNEQVTLAPFDGSTGVFPGAKIRITGSSSALNLPTTMYGGVLDPLGNILAPGTSVDPGISRLGLFSSAPKPLSRTPIDEPLQTGVAAIDGFITVGRGQRIGLIAPAGVGKSTLLSMIARNTEADAVVVALVGERGREVKDFTDMIFDSGRSTRCIVVAATSDESAARRALAPLTATAIAENLRSQGKRVLLLVDSLTRYARAIREVGLAAGESPVRHGYTPSVYAELPRLLERAGTAQRGSITAIYTLLEDPGVGGDPLVQEVQSLLDGHIVLSDELAKRGLRPAIDILRSLSRLAPNLQSPKHSEALLYLRSMLSRLERDRDLILMGATVDSELEEAKELEGELFALLNQTPHKIRMYDETVFALEEMANRSKERGAAKQKTSATG